MTLEAANYPLDEVVTPQKLRYRLDHAPEVWGPCGEGAFGNGSPGYWWPKAPRKIAKKNIFVCVEFLRCVARSRGMNPSDRRISYIYGAPTKVVSRSFRQTRPPPSGGRGAQPISSQPASSCFSLPSVEMILYQFTKQIDG